MSILILCSYCSAESSDEVGCYFCAGRRTEARSGVGGPTSEELELFFLRAEAQRLRSDSNLLTRALLFNTIFRTPRGTA